MYEGEGRMNEGVTKAPSQGTMREVNEGEEKRP